MLTHPAMILQGRGQREGEPRHVTKKHALIGKKDILDASAAASLSLSKKQQEHGAFECCSRRHLRSRYMHIFASTLVVFVVAVVHGDSG